MKTSKTIILATIFSFAVASPWLVGTSLAGGKSTNTPPPAQAKKTYNSGQSTTGYTKANPVSASGAPNGPNDSSGLQQPVDRNGK